MQASPTIAELNQRLAIAGAAQITAGNGGLPRVSVSTPASHSGDLPARCASYLLAPGGLRRGDLLKQAIPV